MGVGVGNFGFLEWVSIHPCDSPKFCEDRKVMPAGFAVRYCVMRVIRCVLTPPHSESFPTAHMRFAGDIELYGIPLRQFTCCDAFSVYVVL